MGVSYLSAGRKVAPMKPLTLFMFLCVALSALSNAAQRKIAYEHGDNVFVADPDGSHAKKIAAGALPEISPDGTRIAFNTEGDAKNRPGPERHIAITDLASRYRQYLPDGSGRGRCYEMAVLEDTYLREHARRWSTECCAGWQGSAD